MLASFLGVLPQLNYDEAATYSAIIHGHTIGKRQSGDSKPCCLFALLLCCKDLRYSTAWCLDLVHDDFIHASYTLYNLIYIKRKVNT
jgi:hypothetical protein